MVLKEARDHYKIHHRGRIYSNNSSNKSRNMTERICVIFIWRRRIARDYYDNQAAIAISNDLVVHGMTKHSKVKFCFLTEAHQNGDLTLIYRKSENQLADLFTWQIC